MKSEFTGSAGNGAAISGATALTIAALFAGVVNYIYTSGMGVFLPTASYSVFATAQAFLFLVGTVVSAAVPWFLAQRIAADPPGNDTDTVLTFSFSVNAAIAVATAVLAVVLIYPIGGIAAATATAVAAAVVSVGSLAVGLFVGYGRIIRLSVMRVAEVTLRFVVGLGLVLAGSGATAAIVATAIGSFVFVVPTFVAMTRIRWNASGLKLTRWWQALVGHGALQLGIVLLATLDIILIAFAPLSAEEIAGYQLTAALSRVTFYFALALALAAFAQWVRSSGGDILPILRHYLVIALPVTFVIGSLPRSLLSFLYPELVASMKAVLPIMALESLLLGFVVILLVRLQVQNNFGAGASLLIAGVAALIVAVQVGGSFGPQAIAMSVAMVAGSVLVGALLIYRAKGGGLDVGHFRVAPWVLLSGVIVLFSNHWIWYPMALFISALVFRETIRNWNETRNDL